MLTFDDIIWPYDAIVWDLVLKGMPWSDIPHNAQILFVRSGGGKPKLLKIVFQNQIQAVLDAQTIDKSVLIKKYPHKNDDTKVDYNALYEAVEFAGLFTYEDQDDVGGNYRSRAVESDKYHAGEPFHKRYVQPKVGEAADFGDFKSTLGKVTGVLRKMQPLIAMDPVYGPMFNQAISSVDGFVKTGKPEHALMALNVAMDTSDAYKNETGDFRDDLFGHPSVKQGIKDTLVIMSHMKDDPVYKSLSNRI